VGGLSLPDGVEVAAVTRFGVPLLVDDSLVLEPDDQLTIVGPEGVMPTPGDPAPAA
jgi:Trk K+ transport system NAD-binding subunit